MEIKAKIDTGARTSAIHAWNIQPVQRDDGLHVTFQLHPVQRNNRTILDCTARVVDQRAIRNSGGQSENRYIISTKIQIGEHHMPIELSLTRRDEMGFRMLLGRIDMKDRFVINPAKSFLMGKR